MRCTMWLIPAVAFGCSHPPDSVPKGPAAAASAALILPADMAGCYALFDKHGRPASKSLYFAPPMVRLDTTARPGDPSGWRLTKLGPDGDPVTNESGLRGFQYWTVHTAPDSVQIHFHTGFSGTEMILPARGPAAETLRGRALEHWDMGPSTNDAGQVTAVRVRCVSEAG